VAKQVTNTAILKRSDDSFLEVTAGDYAIYAGAVIEEGDPPASTTTITEATLQAGYTPV
jgi:hypothetical protein